jgi:transposase-like protein
MGMTSRQGGQQPLSIEQLGIIQAALDRGASYSQAAAAAGTTKGSVYRYMRKAKQRGTDRLVPEELAISDLPKAMLQQQLFSPVERLRAEAARALYLRRDS